MEGTDYISTCERLYDILKYLPSNEVLRCMEISKQFKKTINTNWNKMNKPRATISITKTNPVALRFDLFLGAKYECCVSIFPKLLETQKSNFPPCIKHFIAKQVFHVKEENELLQYEIGSTAEGLTLVLKAILNRIYLKSFKIDCRLVYVRDPNLNDDELISIRNCLYENPSSKYRNISVKFCSLTYFPIYSDIIAALGSNECSLSTNGPLKNTIPMLPLHCTDISFHDYDWKTEEMIAIVENWLNGQINIKHLEVKGSFFTLNPAKWDQLYSALDVIPLSGIGYIKDCDERFELRRDCDDKVLDVCYYKDGYKIELEEIQPL